MGPWRGGWRARGGRVGVRGGREGMVRKGGRGAGREGNDKKLIILY